MLGAFCQCLCICRNLALSQTQRQFQCRLCRAGTHQRTVGAGDEELFYIDGLTAGRTQIHRAHRADGIAAVGACQTGDADSDIGPGSFCRAKRHLCRHRSRHHIVFCNDCRFHTYHFCLGLFPVGDKAEAEHLACTGHIGQPLGDHAACAAFCRGNGEPLFLQGVHQSLFQTGHILIIHRITQQIIELCGVCAAHFFG